MAGEQVLHARGGSLAVRGRVLLDGAPASPAAMGALRRAAGFVAQDDQLLPTLTVREAVAFSAALRLPAYDDAAVDAVIARAGLAHVAHNRVGGANAARGVSGGERRRVSIAQELVTNPPLLFLDEPTSGATPPLQRFRTRIALTRCAAMHSCAAGLDAFTAASLVDTLARLAAEGHAVVAAVHQPSAEVFGAFSSVVLLSQGRALWRGAPSALDATLAAAGAPCPPGRNPADHLLQLASVEGDADALARAGGETGAADDAEESGGELTERSAAAAAEAEELPVRRVSVMAAAAVPAPHAADSGASASSASGRGAAAAKRAAAPHAAGGVLAAARRELRTLAWREALHYARSPSLLLTHLAVALLLSVWIGIIYFKVTRDLAGFQNRAGAAFFTLTSFGFGALSALELFIGDRPLFAKERHRYYSPLSYFAVKASVDAVCLRLIPGALYGAIFYFMMGWQPAASKFFIFLAGLLLTCVSTSALAIGVSMLVNTVAVGTVLMSFILLQMCIFGGFLSNTAAMPLAVSWLRFLSLFFYAFETLLSNELDGIALDFTVSGFVSVRDIDGSSFLTTLNQNPKRIGADVACLACLTVALNAVAALLLVLRSAPPGGYALLRVRRPGWRVRRWAPCCARARRVAVREAAAAQHVSVVGDSPGRPFEALPPADGEAKPDLEMSAVPAGGPWDDEHTAAAAKDGSIGVSE
jgi:ATP-binding cassette subfamily G (WHITE) protein 2